MGNILTDIIAIFIIAPILLFVLLYGTLRALTKKPKRSFQLSADWSTIFIILSVHFIIIAIWGKSLLFLIIMVILVCVGIFTYLYWKLKGDLNFLKILKGAWRFQFMLFSLLYIFLLFYGIFSSALNFLS